MNKTLGDNLSRLLTKAFDVLLINPFRTTLGILLGIIFEIFSRIFSPLMKELSWINLSSLIIWHYIALGIFILHVQPLISLLFHKPEVDENLEMIFKIINKAKKEGVSEKNIEHMYLKICETMIENIETAELIEKKPRETEEMCLKNRKT